VSLILLPSLLAEGHLREMWDGRLKLNPIPHHFIYFILSFRPRSTFSKPIIDTDEGAPNRFGETIARADFITFAALLVPFGGMAWPVPSVVLYRVRILFLW
jgi:hypothetical protein